MMGLFANKIGGIANKIGGITNKILVLFDRSIRIPRAHARIHKVFTLATVATLQHYLRISVLRVTTRWQGWQRMAILP